MGPHSKPRAGIVLGAPCADWRGLDLPGHSVRLAIDGKTVAEGEGRNVLGDPVNALIWLVNHQRRRGVTLAEGAVISTGTTTGLTALAPGQVAVADYGSLGSVSVTFVE